MSLWLVRCIDTTGCHNVMRFAPMRAMAAMAATVSSIRCKTNLISGTWNDWRSRKVKSTKYFLTGSWRATPCPLREKGRQNQKCMGKDGKGSKSRAEPLAIIGTFFSSPVSVAGSGFRRHAQPTPVPWRFGNRSGHSEFRSLDGRWNRSRLSRHSYRARCPQVSAL